VRLPNYFLPNFRFNCIASGDRLKQDQSSLERFSRKLRADIVYLEQSHQSQGNIIEVLIWIQEVSPFYQFTPANKSHSIVAMMDVSKIYEQWG
jgi:hypothetical protein